MSTNPNNYVGATTTLVGYTAGEARNPAYDKDGTKGVKEISIAINEGYKPEGKDFVKTGTTWYTYSAAGDYADRLLDIPKGSKVRIEDAKQEVRTYEKDGETVAAVGLRFGTITVLEQGRGESEAPRDTRTATAKAADSNDGW